MLQRMRRRAALGRRPEIVARARAVGRRRELRERRTMSALLLPIRLQGGGARHSCWLSALPARL
jgi:hypothetical protein